VLTRDTEFTVIKYAPQESRLFHFDLNLNIRYNPLIFPVLPFFVVVKIGSFFLFRIYKMTWRYVGLYDFLSIFIATVIATSLLMLSVLLPVDLPLSGFSTRVILADGIITLFPVSNSCPKRLMEDPIAGSRLF